MPELWLFFHACGHPFGVLTADHRSPTERRAWSEFYDTEKQRRAAEDRGVTCKGISWDTYRAEHIEAMRTGCHCEETGAS